MDVKHFTELFAYGTHLCREPMPDMAEMKRDMENLKAHGFNMIKLQINWAVTEPRDGVYDFSPYEELTAHAAKLDLAIYAGFILEHAPHWLWRKHPGCRMVGRNGVPVAYEAVATLPGDGKPGPCFDEDGARADSLRYLTRAVQTLGRFENIVLWSTWQEIGYWGEGDWLIGQSVCFCPHTLAFFRQWLRETWHGDLGALNRAWKTNHGDWADILPTRTVRGRDGHPVDMAWSAFMMNVQIPRVLRVRAETIRAADPLRRPVMAHKASPAIGATQDWDMARCQDFMGSSSYPAWFPFRSWDDGAPSRAASPERTTSLWAEAWNGMALTYEYTRCANRPGAQVWAAELQGGPVNTCVQKGRVPSPEDMRRWVLTGVSVGLTGISYWVTRAEIAASEGNGFSLLDSEGDTTPRYEEASRLGRALNQHAELFGRSTLAPAQAAILINDENHRFCDALPQGGEHHGYSVRGWHRLFWDAGIPVDFLNAEELSARGGDYRAIVLPFPLCLSEVLAGQLAAYVTQGGNLLSEAGPGRVTEYNFCRRGELSQAMRELLGVRHQSFQMIREPEGAARWSTVERTWGEYLPAAFLTGVGPLAGHKLRANVYVETFECLNGTPVLMHGERVAGVTRRVGKGQAWLLGTFCGHNGTAHRDEATRACLGQILAQCGVLPAHPGKLLLRKRVTPSKEAWLFTNPAAAPVTEPVNVQGWSGVTDLLGEPVQREGDTVVLTVPGLDIRVLILTR